MRYTCDHSGDRTQMCITCMNYESRIHSLQEEIERLKSLRPTSFKEVKESEAWRMRAEEANQEIERLKSKLTYPDALTGSEYTRLVEWMNDPERKEAIIAFTASACRDAARAFERCELVANNMLECENCKILEDNKQKLMEALKKIANKEIEFPDYDWSDWNGGDAQREAKNLIAQFAQLVLSGLDQLIATPHKTESLDFQVKDLKQRLRDLVLDDVPHQHQERLLEALQ